MASRITGDTAESVIAKSTKVVHDTVLGIDRKVIAGQAIPPDLVDAYQDAGGDVGGPEAVTSGQRLATATTVVHDDAMGIDRKVIAGQPVPPDLVDAYNDTVGADDRAAAPAPDTGEPITGDYDGHQVGELEAEATRRGLEVEGTGQDGRVLKADLVAALEASDE